MSNSLIGTKVFVYFNLHKKVFSVKALEGDSKGLVIAHSGAVRLSNPTAKVSEAGRQRVIAQKSKNVHAGVVGVLESLECTQQVGGLGQLTYNPYKTKTFIHKEGGQDFTGSDYCFMIAANNRAAVFVSPIQLSLSL